MARHESLWPSTASLPEAPPLAESTNADVCVVGAGIAGLTTAYLLGLEGKKVVVLEDGAIGGRQTERTTAHLSNALDDRYHSLERLHGHRGARLAAESHGAAIDRIERIVEAESIDCSFERVDGYLFAPPGGSTKELEQELEAAHRAGLGDVAWVDRAPIEGFDTGRCLRFPRQGQFHPLRYLAGLARGIVRDGGRLYAGTHVESLEKGVVKTKSGFTVNADHVVIATNSPIHDRYVMHTKQAPYTSYVVGIRIAGTIPHALFWDTLDPYHYVRVQDDVLIVGGEDHKTGHADDAVERYDRLEQWARERWKGLGGVAYRWSGQVMEPVDGMAFIGRNPMDDGSIFIATGDSGHGMTHGTIAGILLRDAILGRPNDWAPLYAPNRKTLRALPMFAKENLDVAAQLTDWVTGGDVKSVEEIKPGEGAIVRHGLTKLAVYRDENGTLHERSAVCPHLGCIVAWNSDDKTWDCPCHGSKFDCHGKVVNGPSAADLAKA